MAKPATCHGCVYAQFDRGLWLRTLGSGFPARPTCANQPQAPGLIRECPPGPVCRNYRARPPTPTGEHVKMILLPDGFCTYVDADNFEWLSQYKWSCNSSGYAARREKGKLIFMHREIMRPPKGKFVDHIDCNRLNNCCVNMRNCTREENLRNQRKRAGSTSKFKGVYYFKKSGKWCARITYQGKDHWLGCFTDEIEAARAYDRRAVELGIVFARLNFPEEWPPKRRARVYRQHQAAGKGEGKKGEKGRGPRDGGRGGRRHAHAALGRGTRRQSRH